MNRVHAFVLSLVLGACGVTGAIAATQTAHLGIANAPAEADSAAFEARARRLDSWASSLRASLAKRPPRLPSVPRYGAVVMPDFVAATPVALQTTPPAAKARRTHKPDIRSTATVRASTEKRTPAPVDAPGRTEPTQPADPPPAPPTPSATTAATETAPTTTAVPAPPPPPTSTSTTTTTRTEPSSNGGGDDRSDDGPDSGGDD